MTALASGYVQQILNFFEVHEGSLPSTGRTQERLLNQGL